MRDYALEGAGQAEVTYQYYYYRNHSRTVLTCQFIYLDDRTVSEYSNILYFPPLITVLVNSTILDSALVPIL